MNKPVLTILCTVIFITVTIFVLATDTGSQKLVRFSNQSFSVSNGTQKISNTSGVKLTSESTGITNTEIEAKNVEVKTTNSGSIDGMLWDYDDAKVKTGNNVGVKNKKTEFNNLDTGKLDEALANAQNGGYKYDDMSDKPRQRVNEYSYKDIDWGTWKSNFVNTILDDSLSIKSLDNYGEGSWFFYSFIVDSSGRITNITVKSMYLSAEDKAKVERLIKSYQHKPITAFPRNSTRKTAKVSAVMLLSDETKKSTPGDFNDRERVKLKKY